MKRFLPLSLLLLLACFPRGAMAIEAPPAHGSQETIEPEDLPEKSVPDAMQLYTLGRVVVVYPAGPGEDVEKNKASAERRARFLDKVRGVQARALADTAFSAAEKDENLVLLGWNNRVLGTAAAPRPFTHTGSGISFLGLEVPDPSLDLLFYGYSPFRKDRYVLFWSRIDPELDRFMVLPWIGSNWALLKGFLPVHQGMFRGGDPVWPPVRNPDAEIDRTEPISDLEAARQIRRSDHYDIYYIPSDSLTREMDTIVQAREAAFARAVQVLGPPPDGFRIRLFVYADEKDKEDRSGVKDPAHSIPQQRELHLVERLARNAACHEEIHVLARPILGPCTLTSLYEGLALSVDGTYAGVELDVYAAALVENGTLPTLDVLLREAEAAALGDKLHFPAAGLLGSWLRSMDADALRRAYSLNGEGAEALGKALGRKPEALEAAFKIWVQGRAKARSGDLAFIKEQSSAQDRYLAGDYPGVIAALERALKVKPDDPQTLFNLAAAQVRTGAYPEAEKNLKRIPTLTIPKRDSQLVIFSWYQLGRLYDIQGRREDALAKYRHVLELPDQKDAHRLAQEAIAKPVTKDQLE